MKTSKPHWVTPRRFYIECSECKTRYSSEIMTVFKDGKSEFEIPQFCPHCGVKMEDDDEQTLNRHDGRRDISRRGHRGEALQTHI